MGRIARRRAQREMERRLRELDRLDAKYGLGAMPTTWRRRPSRLRQALLSATTVLAVIVGTCAVLAFAPVEAGTAFRQLTGINRPDRLLPEVKPSAKSDEYAVAATLPNGDPITYDPCKAIHYVVNPVNGPSDYRAFIDSAVQAAEAASGLRFVYDGESDENWASRSRGATRRPLLITFNVPDEVPELAGKTVGLGGSLSSPADGRTPHYLTGAITLDSEWFRNASANRRTREERSIVMHELGHVIGLDHVDDVNELMYADNVGQLDYGPGDRTGFALLGAGPCA